MSEQNSGEGRIVNPTSEYTRDDGPGDAGDEANDIRFSEEQALINEQAHGVRPDGDDVPAGEPSMDQALGDLDLPDANLGEGEDGSDDALHAGGTA